MNKRFSLLILAFTLVFFVFLSTNAAASDWAKQPMEKLTKVVLSVEEGPIPETLSLFKDEIKTKLNIDLQIAAHPFDQQFAIQKRDLTVGGRYDIVSFWVLYGGDLKPYCEPLGNIAPEGEKQVWNDMYMDDILPGYLYAAYL